MWAKWMFCEFYLGPSSTQVYQQHLVGPSYRGVLVRGLLEVLLVVVVAGLLLLALGGELVSLVLEVEAHHQQQEVQQQVLAVS